MQPDNNLFDIVQIRMQQCCAAHPQQPLLSTLFTPVGTMLLTIDALTMLFNHDNNIDHTLFSEQYCINLINF